MYIWKSVWQLCYFWALKPLWKYVLILIHDMLSSFILFPYFFLLILSLHYIIYLLSLDKSNYRPVSILPLQSKVYERVIYNQFSEYSNNFLNEVLCGFRKVDSAHHALFKLLQSWKKSLDCRGFVGTILMDLSKAYDCTPHEWLIAKLHCYGVNNATLKLLLDYLINHKQRTKIGSSFSSWHDTDTCVLQRSILGPLLFNTFINDLVFSIKKSEVCNFADNNTLSSNKDLDHVFNNLYYDLNNVLDWFKFNSLKANPDKFQFMVLGAKKNKSFSINIRGMNIASKHEVILLGITIDHELKFNKRIEDLWKRASFKLHALRRIRKYLGIGKARIFIESHFNYAPLIWMFGSKMAINKICKLYYRTLKVVYNENDKSHEELLEINKSHEELLEINKSASIHHRHLQFLAIEVYNSLMH